MDRERAITFGTAAALLMLALLALLAIDQTREHSTPPRRSRAFSPRSPRAPKPSRLAPRPRPNALTAARRFAGDWLEYLAGRRPVSAVRAADPSLLVAFAGGGAREALGPGREGLRTVRCRPPHGGRRDCRARVARLPALRFTLAVHGTPRVVALALD
jgi:hypothetical protein